jgi:hypothetical protein
MGSVYGISGVGFTLREVSASNTTTTAVALALVKLTTAGTQGSEQTSTPKWDDERAGASCQVFDVHSSSGPSKSNPLKQMSLAAAIGAGVIWTFGGDGIRVPAGTANGAGVICATGTTQICDLDFTWDE